MKKCRLSLQITGIACFSWAVGSWSAGAETFQHGGSTTVIEQSGAGASRSEVSRYPDGQRIVTQDGSNTDITIQQGGAMPDSGGIGSYSQSQADRFSQGFFDERRPPSESGARTDDDCLACPPSRLREAFKQQMLERMGGGY